VTTPSPRNTATVRPRTRMMEPTKRTADYARSVFLNCPFDRQFSPLLRAAVFAIIDLGFHPRSARDTSDGSQVRIDKLYEMIRSCRWQA